MTKISSEMEVVPRYQLSTLLTLLPPYTLFTLFEQLWSYKAIMPVLGYIDLLVSEQKAEWSVLSVRMDCGYH